MSLSDRIHIMISESGLTQKRFAESINVTESHISKLIKGKTGLSKSTAALIEERYGYNVDWIMNGNEPKIKEEEDVETKRLNLIQQKIISDIKQMDENELIAVKSFIQGLESYKKMFKKE